MDLPTFQLQNDKQQQLFTLRLPASVDLASLEGCQIPLSALKEGCSVPLNRKEEVETDAKSLQWTVGEAAETQQFRLLTKRQANDEDDENGSYLMPVPVPFSGHYVIAEANTADLNVNFDTSQAPSMESAPTPSVPVTYAYDHRPQWTDMRRRWKPLGSNAQVVNETATRKRSRSNSAVSLMEQYLQNQQRQQMMKIKREEVIPEENDGMELSTTQPKRPKAERNTNDDEKVVKVEEATPSPSKKKKKKRTPRPEDFGKHNNELPEEEPFSGKKKKKKDKNDSSTPTSSKKKKKTKKEKE